MAERIDLNNLENVIRTMRSGKIVINFDEGNVTGIRIKRARKEDLLKRKFYK